MPYDSFILQLLGRFLSEGAFPGKKKEGRWLGLYSFCEYDAGPLGKQTNGICEARNPYLSSVLSRMS